MSFNDDNFKKSVDTIGDGKKSIKIDNGVDETLKWKKSKTKQNPLIKSTILSTLRNLNSDFAPFLKDNSNFFFISIVREWKVSGYIQFNENYDNGFISSGCGDKKKLFFWTLTTAR